MFEMIDALEPRRLLAALDPNFGDHGATIFRFEISDAYYVAAQADGKALVGLYFFPGSRFGKEGFSYAVGRTNADGSIDQSFGGPDGSTFADIRTTPREEARILAVMDQANKPLALAFDNGDVNLLRFRSDGTLDPKFANGGRILFKSGQFPIE